MQRIQCTRDCVAVNCSLNVLVFASFMNKLKQDLQDFIHKTRYIMYVNVNEEMEFSMKAEWKCWWWWKAHYIYNSMLYIFLYRLYVGYWLLGIQCSMFCSRSHCLVYENIMSMICECVSVAIQCSYGMVHWETLQPQWVNELEFWHYGLSLWRSALPTRCTFALSLVFNNIT